MISTLCSLVRIRSKRRSAYSNDNPNLTGRRDITAYHTVKILSFIPGNRAFTIEGSRFRI